MPFVPQARLDEMQAEIDTFHGMAGLLNLAQLLKQEIGDLLEGGTSLTTTQIGQLAYNAVLESELERANDEVVAQYEQNHRRELYRKVVEDVERVDGPRILEEVMQRLDSDPDLVLELRESARAELAAKAMGVIRDQVTDEQEREIAKEAERQLILDRLDVRLAVDGELEIDDDVKELLKPHDRLELNLIDDHGYEVTITLEWIEDVNDKRGWVFCDQSGTVYYNDSGWREIFAPSSGRFIKIGTVEKDLEDGDEVFSVDTLVIGMSVAFGQKGSFGRQNKMGAKKIYTTYGDEDDTLKLFGTDFQTKALKLVE